MAKWNVTYRYVCEDSWVIEADTEKEAIKKAENDITKFETRTIKKYILKAMKVEANK